MTLTYDGYFLSGPGNEDAQSSSSSQSLSGGVNGTGPRSWRSPGKPRGSPRESSKKRPSGGSLHSTGAPSDYESDISFSGDPMMVSRRSPGLMNGHPPRNDLNAMKMDPQTAATTTATTLTYDYETA